MSYQRIQTAADMGKVRDYGTVGKVRDYGITQKVRDYGTQGKARHEHAGSLLGGLRTQQKG